ncbi:hypothetical protein [Pseudomonas sp. BMS12]|uniref:hypothetical protein n=1 Tax=Pseudomonas sp. BMS12 TaxID=1796033 RepID=UPI000A3E3C41|nr:hypothetical protein [Pseudomonas sp. BMS12]
MYVLLAVLGLVFLLASASLASAVLVGHALLHSRLIDDEAQPSPSVAVAPNRRTQPLTA